jgi:hypothetical protein
MPSDLSIKAVSPVVGASENPAEPKPETLTPPGHAPPASAGPPIINPKLKWDPALGLVVIEFRDNSGNLTTTIPTQAQLKAYRTWGESPLQGNGSKAEIHTPATSKT